MNLYQKDVDGINCGYKNYVSQWENVIGLMNIFMEWIKTFGL